MKFRNLNWYLNRLKTMSVPEIGYRVKQNFQKKLEKIGFYKINHSAQNYHEILASSCKINEAPIPDGFTKQFNDYKIYEFFGTQLDISKKIEWHKDVISSKNFPLTFAKDIDIRTEKYGSAKVVWEINRLQFLLPLAIKCVKSGNTSDLALWMGLLENWIDENPYLRGVNWYSNIEINIRLIVWHFCWEVLWNNDTIAKNKDFIDFCEKKWLPSIYEHCKYSYNNPSHYSSANNHLIAEYAGLYVAASRWNFKESRSWKQYARKGLEKEIQIQYTPRGINKEEAAEYIQFITDFFMLPFAVAVKFGDEFSVAFKDRLLMICDYIYNLLDIKGNYCKYGDEDDGKVLLTSTDKHFDNFSSLLVSAVVISNSDSLKLERLRFDLKNWLLWSNKGYATFEALKTPGIAQQSKFYQTDGHFIFRKQTGNQEIYMHFDVAPLGFLSIAAHGHADALSFNLHLNGLPYIVDAGTYTYHTEPEWRHYFLSTIAHNTLCIDGVNQATQAGPTIWLKHYQTNVLAADCSEDNETVKGTHNGYADIGCTHNRTVVFHKNDDLFEIIDEVIVHGEGVHKIQFPIHLHPNVNVQSQSDNEILLMHKNCDKQVLYTMDNNFKSEIINGSVSPILGWYSPSFLLKQPTTVLLAQTTINKTQKFRSLFKVS